MKPSTVSAVASSPGYQALCGHARASGVDQEALDDLLWLLNAHYEFVGHGQVLANVATLLAQPTFSPENLYWARHWPQLLDGIREVVAWANAERHHLADLPGLEAWNALPGGKRDNPLLGRHVDRHPLAAALWCAPNPGFDEMASRGYLWIQAQALSAPHWNGRPRNSGSMCTSRPPSMTSDSSAGFCTFCLLSHRHMPKYFAHRVAPQRSEQWMKAAPCPWRPQSWTAVKPVNCPAAMWRAG